MEQNEKIAELEAALAAEKAKNEVKPGDFYIKFGNKRNVVVGGKALGQRFPVTLYAPSWLVLLEHKDEIYQFIKDNHDQLSWER